MRLLDEFVFVRDHASSGLDGILGLIQDVVRCLIWVGDNNCLLRQLGTKDNGAHG